MPEYVIHTTANTFLQFLHLFSKNYILSLLTFVLVTKVHGV